MRILITILLFLLAACGKSQVTVNAPGQPPTVTINNGPPTVTVNYREYFDAQTGDITFTDDHFWFSVPGRAETGFTARSPQGYIIIKTSETSLDFKAAGNWSTASSTVDEQSELPILVDGVYDTSLQVTLDNTIQTFTRTFPPGEKIITLLNGYTANGSSVTIPDAGVYFQGIETTGTIEIKRPTVPINKWLFIGNSIETDALASHPGATGLVSKFRADGRQLQLDSWGGRRQLTTSTLLADEMAAYVAAQMDGSVSNECFNFLGTNNFGLSGGHSKANFKLYYEYFLDALHTLRPDIIIYCISPLNRQTYSTPNSQGATCEDYADAIQELLVTRSWAKFIYGKDLVSLANMGDAFQIHPNDAGYVEMHDNLLIEYNLLQ